jgi:hypothetical protein
MAKPRASCLRNGLARLFKHLAISRSGQFAHWALALGALGALDAVGAGGGGHR